MDREGAQAEGLGSLEHAEVLVVGQGLQLGEGILRAVHAPSRPQGGRMEADPRLRMGGEVGDPARRVG